MGVRRVCARGAPPLVFGWALLVVLFLMGACVQSEADGGGSRVALESVTYLDVDRREWTAARRIKKPRRQLECVGEGCDRYAVDRMKCQRGSEWQCTPAAGLPPGVSVTQVRVACEGYDEPGDSFVLRGSCGVRYGLDVASWKSEAARETYVRREARDPWDPRSGKRPKGQTGGLDGVLALAGFMIVAAIVAGSVCLPGNEARGANGKSKAGRGPAAADAGARSRPGRGSGSSARPGGGWIPGWVGAEWDVAGWWESARRYMGPVLRYLLVRSLFRRSTGMMGGRGLFGGMGGMRRPGMYSRRFYY